MSNYTNINEVEFKLLQKIICDSNLYYKTKINIKMFTDSIACTFWKFIGNKITSSTAKSFIPKYHLKEIVEDTSKLNKLNSLCPTYKGKQYSFTSVDDIIDFFDLFKDDEVDFSDLENVIKNTYIRTELMKLGNELMMKSEDSDENTIDIVKNMSLKLDKLMCDADTEVELLSFSEIIENEIRNQENPDSESFSPTCIQIIDEIAGGVRAPATIYPLAAPKIGKSTILYDIANKLIDAGRTVLFATIEIGIEEFTQKFIANRMGIEYNKIAKSQWSSDTEKKEYLNELRRFKEILSNKLFVLHDKSGISCKSIEANVMLLKKSGVDIDDICVDYLGLLESDESKTDTDKFRTLPKEVRILSQKTHTRIFIPHQLHSTVKDRPIDKIMESDIYFAKTISQEATAMFILHRQLYSDGTKKDWDDRLMMKSLPSRIEWNDEVFVFPDNNQSKLHIGEGINIRNCPPILLDFNDDSDTIPAYAQSSKLPNGKSLEF